MSYESIKPNSEIRAAARSQLKGKWGMPILVCFLFCVITGVSGSIPYIGCIISIIIGGPMSMGLVKYFILLKREENPGLENLFDGFKMFTPNLVLYLLIALFTFLWGLLLIIPGIIKGLGYSMSFYILNDNPGMPATEAIKQSQELMRGNKGKLFLLELSFIGWALLCVLTLFIGYLWLMPYMQLSMANFYENLKNNREGVEGAE